MRAFTFDVRGNKWSPISRVKRLTFHDLRDRHPLCPFAVVLHATKRSFTEREQRTQIALTCTPSGCV